MMTTYPLSKTHRLQLAAADRDIQIATQAKKLIIDTILAHYDVTEGHVSITDAGLVVETPDPVVEHGESA